MWKDIELARNLALGGGEGACGGAGCGGPGVGVGELILGLLPEGWCASTAFSLSFLSVPLSEAVIDPFALIHFFEGIW